MSVDSLVSYDLRFKPSLQQAPQLVLLADVPKIIPRTGRTCARASRRKSSVEIGGCCQGCDKRATSPRKHRASRLERGSASRRTRCANAHSPARSASAYTPPPHRRIVNCAKPRCLKNRVVVVCLEFSRILFFFLPPSASPFPTIIGGE